MFPSIFTDELGLDVAEALPVIRSWGLNYCDLRSRVFGKAIEQLDGEELRKLKQLLRQNGLKIGCLQTSLAKVHLPDPERRDAEADKLEGIIRAAEALDCRLVRSFFYWQPGRDSELLGRLNERPDEQQKVLEAFMPLAGRAREAGLTLAFENCGVTHDEVLAIYPAFNVPQWGLAWDVHNTWDCDERRQDEGSFIRRLAGHARLVHVKARGAVSLPGTECIPYDKVLDVCHNAGLRGPVSAETHNPDGSIENVEMSRRVVEVIRNAWPSAAPGALEPEPSVKVERPWAGDPVGFVVVGLGMGHGRAKTVQKNSGAKLLGVCDLDIERAKRTGEACGVPYTTDVRPWLEREDVEVVYVLTETGRHAEVAIQALQAGKHALVTKPMEANVAACDEMIKAADAGERILAVDVDRRFRKTTLELKRAVQEELFGRLLLVNCQLKILRTMDYFRSNGGWRGTWSLDGGGVFSNQFIHEIDLLVHVFGPPDRVRARLATQAHEIEAEDLGLATWEYAGGMQVTLAATSSYPHSTWFDTLEVVGTDAAYFSAVGGPFEQPMTRWYRDGAWTGQAPVSVEPEWMNAADNMAGAIRAGAKCVCSGRDGRQSRAVLDAMYRSHKTGRAVELANEGRS